MVSQWDMELQSEACVPGTRPAEQSQERQECSEQDSV
jgi:hypothetical protein